MKSKRKLTDMVRDRQVDGKVKKNAMATYRKMGILPLTKLNSDASVDKGVGGVRVRVLGGGTGARRGQGGPREIGRREYNRRVGKNKTPFIAAPFVVGRGGQRIVCAVHGLACCFVKEAETRIQIGGQYRSMTPNCP